MRDTRNPFKSGFLFILLGGGGEREKRLTDLQRNSIKSHIPDNAVCRRIPHILLLLLSMTHWKKSSTEPPTITFHESASFRGKGERVTMVIHCISLRSHVKTRRLLKPSQEAENGPQLLLQPDKCGRLRGAVSWKSLVLGCEMKSCSQAL